MTTRTLTAMFPSKSEAERASQRLVSELHVDRAMVQTSPGAGVADTGYDKARPYEEQGFFGSLKTISVPDEDRFAYAEGMRRGNVLVTAQVDEAHVGRAADILEDAGAINLDEQEATWRKSGWTGYDAAAHSTMRRTESTGMVGVAPGTTAASARAGGQDETVQVVEERLVVGKRVVEGGRVRVRSYVVERPVEEQVTLHQERVTVERRPVDREATPADLAAFQERTIEARATSEEAVVGKEVHVVEEIGISKEVADRVETIRDTVRRTEVEVDETAGAARTGVAGSAGTADSNLPGTKASRAVDKTLGTNISGANPKQK
jgi:uncharacterized protein (TIGR02271 family)